MYTHFSIIILIYHNLTSYESIEKKQSLQPAIFQNVLCTRKAIIIQVKSILQVQCVYFVLKIIPCIILSILQHKSELIPTQCCKIDLITLFQYLIHGNIYSTQGHSYWFATRNEIKWTLLKTHSPNHRPRLRQGNTCMYFQKLCFCLNFYACVAEL